MPSLSGTPAAANGIARETSSNVLWISRPDGATTSACGVAAATATTAAVSAGSSTAQATWLALYFAAERGVKAARERGVRVAIAELICDTTDFFSSTFSAYTSTSEQKL